MKRVKSWENIAKRINRAHHLRSKKMLCTSRAVRMKKIPNNFYLPTLDVLEKQLRIG